jgi:hypothetical protein
MKSLLSMFLLLLVTSIGSSVYAQNVEGRTYIVEPSTSIISTTNELEEVSKYYIHLKNITGTSIELSWKKLSFDQPTDWDYSLCDLGTCYFGIPDGEHTMFAVEKDSSGFLAPTIYPAGKSGTSTIVIAVWDKNNPSLVDTLTWVITASASSGVTDKKEDENSIHIFPNPSSGSTSFLFDGISTGTLTVIDMNGVSQKEFTVTDAKSFDADLSELSVGQYVMQFVNRDGSIIYSKLLKK